MPSASHSYQRGTWKSCWDGFRTSDQPQRDVTRLSYLCGPYQGMRRYGRTRFAQLKSRPRTFEVRLQRGQCGRVFAASESSIEALRVEVASPSGDRIGVARGRKAFAVVNPASAFCVQESGTFRVTVRAERGRGLAAVEVWTLPPP